MKKDSSDHLLLHWKSTIVPVGGKKQKKDITLKFGGLITRAA